MDSCCDMGCGHSHLSCTCQSILSTISSRSTSSRILPKDIATITIPRDTPPMKMLTPKVPITPTTKASTTSRATNSKVSTSTRSSLFTLDKCTHFIIDCMIAHDEMVAKVIDPVIDTVKSCCKRTRKSFNREKRRVSGREQKRTVRMEDLKAERTARGVYKLNKALPALSNDKEKKKVVRGRVDEEETALLREHLWKDGGADCRSEGGESELAYAGYSAKQMENWSML